jgi:hypothetical protein
MSKLSRRRTGAHSMPQDIVNVPESIDSGARAQPLWHGIDATAGARSVGAAEQAMNRYQSEATSAMRRALASFRRMWL